jgi:transposase
VRGQPAEVPLSGRNARRVVFGALNLRTGYRLLLDREHQRAGDFQAFLRLVRSHYRGWHVVLLLDEDPSHTAKGSVRLAAELGVRLVWLPKRCPELNPMDHLWGHAKEAMCGNRQEATIERLVERFLEHLDELSRWEALTKAGALSGDFWLRV